HGTSNEFTFGQRFKIESKPCRQIDGIGQTVKHVFSLTDLLPALAPICQEGPAKHEHHGFFFGVSRLPNLSGNQTTNEKAHPFPTDVLPREPEQFPRFLGPQRSRGSAESVKARRLHVRHFWTIRATV